MTERRQFCPKGHDTFVVGRDSSHRCLQCKKEAGRAVRYLTVAADRGIREAERTRRREEERERQEADLRSRQEEWARERERKYQAAIRRGGYEATMARWDRASDETLEATGSRFGLCQWEDDDAEGRSMGRLCYRRTTDVYCHVHNRRLEREQAKAER